MTLSLTAGARGWRSPPLAAMALHEAGKGVDGNAASASSSATDALLPRSLLRGYVCVLLSRPLSLSLFLFGAAWASFGAVHAMGRVHFQARYDHSCSL